MFGQGLGRFTECGAGDGEGHVGTRYQDGVEPRVSQAELAREAREEVSPGGGLGRVYTA